MANDYGVNPFESPQSSDEFMGAHDSVIELLRRTRPWVFLFAILGSIGLGLMALGVVGLLIAVGANAGGAGQARLLGMAGGYSIFILIYLYPVICLWRYASRIKRLTLTGDQQYLVGALDAQRGFWKAVGIMTAIIMGIYLLIIIFAFVGIAASRAS